MRERTSERERDKARERDRERDRQKDKRERDVVDGLSYSTHHMPLYSVKCMMLFHTL